MKKYKKVFIIIAVIAIILFVSAKLLKGFVYQTVIESSITAQVEKQYDKEKTNSLKNEINIGQFKSELDKMDNVKYENIDKLVSNATIKEIQKLYESKELTCEELVVFFFWF